MKISCLQDANYFINNFKRFADDGLYNENYYYLQFENGLLSFEGSSMLLYDEDAREFYDYSFG